MFACFEFKCANAVIGLCAILSEERLRVSVSGMRARRETARSVEESVGTMDVLVLRTRLQNR